jgi:CheY-like chemotaxis protein
LNTETAFTNRVVARVLVVEDDSAILDLLRDLLADEGYSISAARNGAEALEQVREAPPDVILLDMLMPVMDGWAFAREYRQLPGSRAAIIVTAATWAEDRAQEIGASDHCAKPFELNTLLERIRRNITHERQTQDGGNGSEW